MLVRVVTGRKLAHFCKVCQYKVIRTKGQASPESKLRATPHEQPLVDKNPVLPFNGCSKKKQVEFYFHVFAVGLFSSLIPFRWTLFVPHYASTLHFNCVQFISPTSAPHSIGGLVAPFHNPRSHFIPQTPVSLHA